MQHIKTKKIKETIESFKIQREQFIPTVKQYCTSKGVDLNERLEVFFESGVGNHYSSIWQSKILNTYSCGGDKYSSNTIDDHLFDGDRYHRHETIHLDEIVERLEEAVDEFDEWNNHQLHIKAFDESHKIQPYYPGKYSLDVTKYTNKEGKHFDRDTLNEFKEEILKEFIKSFDMDW